MEKVKDTETTAQKASRTELTRLRKLVKLVPDNKKSVANSLIKELSFMAGTLEELKENITEHGAVDYFKNGKQEMWRESPALKSYNTTIQRYSLLYKQLCDLLPKEEATKVQQDGGLMDFIGV
jgi:hypothetical protein